MKIKAVESTDRIECSFQISSENDNEVLILKQFLGVTTRHNNEIQIQSNIGRDSVNIHIGWKEKLPISDLMNQNKKLKDEVSELLQDMLALVDDRGCYGNSYKEVIIEKYREKFKNTINLTDYIGCKKSEVCICIDCILKSSCEFFKDGRTTRMEKCEYKLTHVEKPPFKVELTEEQKINIRKAIEEFNKNKKRNRTVTDFLVNFNLIQDCLNKHQSIPIIAVKNYNHLLDHYNKIQEEESDGL